MNKVEMIEEKHEERCENKVERIRGIKRGGWK